MAGENQDISLDIDLDVIPDVDVSAGKGVSIDINPNTGKPQITSAGPMYATETKLGGGVSLLPLPLGGGLQFGSSQTTAEIYYQLPFWP